MLMPFTKWITIPWMVWTISVRSASAFVRIRSSTMFSNPRILPSSSKYRIAHLNVKWCDNKGCLIFRSRLGILLPTTFLHSILLFFIFRYCYSLPIWLLFSGCFVSNCSISFALINQKNYWGNMIGWYIIQICVLWILTSPFLQTNPKVENSNQ